MYAVNYVFGILIATLGFFLTINFFESGRTDWWQLIFGIAAFIFGCIVQRVTQKEFDQERQARISFYERSGR